MKKQGRYKPFSPTEKKSREENDCSLGCQRARSLCVHEAASRHAQSHLRRFAPAVWWGSLVEVHSAICRLHRDKEITDLDKRGAVARLRLLNRGWREILPGDQVRDLATQLLDKHSFRA